MKKTIFAAAIAALVLPFTASAQPKPTADPGLTFTVIKENPITSIKDQNRSGTCWCFSAMAFLESEAIRINNLKKEAEAEETK